MKILIIHPFGIGDLIFSFPLAECLVKDLGAEVHYLCNERTHVLAEANPSIKGIHVFDRAGSRQSAKSNPLTFPKVYLGLIGAWRREHYDYCFDLSLGREFSALAAFAGIKHRIGFNYKKRGTFLTQKVAFSGFEEKSVREHYLDLLRLTFPARSFVARYPDIPFRKLRANALMNWQESVGLSGEYFVIAPGGGETWGSNAKYKRWPIEHFAQLASFFLERKDRFAVVMAGPGDESICEELLTKLPEDRVRMVVEKDLLTSAALLREAEFVVANDGGVLHLADLAGARAIGLYGPVSDKVYGPLEKTGRTAVLGLEVPCRPCYNKFRFTGCSYEHQCLRDLSPEMVFNEARSLVVT